MLYLEKLNLSSINLTINKYTIKKKKKKKKIAYSEI